MLALTQRYQGNTTGQDKGEEFYPLGYMTAFALTDIPTNINTIEQLHVWTGMCLHELYPAVTAVEGVNIQEFAVVANNYYVGASNKRRQVTRTSLELEGTALSANKKLWQSVVPIGALPLTAAMKAN
jgi:hypothetical protein